MEVASSTKIATENKKFHWQGCSKSHQHKKSVNPMTAIRIKKVSHIYNRYVDTTSVENDFPSPPQFFLNFIQEFINQLSESNRVSGTFGWLKLH